MKKAVGNSNPVKTACTQETHPLQNDFIVGVHLSKGVILGMLWGDEGGAFPPTTRIAVEVHTGVRRAVHLPHDVGAHIHTFWLHTVL